jgi:hypothetical protein
LAARGFAAAALNGDVVQSQRERLIEHLRAGKLNILVATDVAARGLDVDRISHVINYDIPYDTEAYVHRIGRTGRAGRSGEAILFVAPRERRMLMFIEQATRQKIEQMRMPTAEAINDKRIAAFKNRIADTLATMESDPELPLLRAMVEQFILEQGANPVDVAAGLARMVHGAAPFLLTVKAPRSRVEPGHRDYRASDEERGEEQADVVSHAEKRPAHQADHPEGGPRKKRLEGQMASSATKPGRPFPRRSTETPTSVGSEEPGGGISEPRRPRTRSREERVEGLTPFRVEIGRNHGVQPGNLVGAIAGESGLDSSFIGRIKLFDEYSLVDLPTDLSDKTLTLLKGVRVLGRPLNISRASGEEVAAMTSSPRSARRSSSAPGPRPFASRERPDVEPKRGPVLSRETTDVSDKREKPEKHEKPERPKKPETSEKTDRAEKVEKIEGTEKLEKTVRSEKFPELEKPDRPEKKEKLEKSGEPEKPEKLEKPEKSERPERSKGTTDPDKPLRPARRDWSEKSPKPWQGDRPDQRGRPARPAKPGGSQASAGSSESEQRPENEDKPAKPAFKRKGMTISERRARKAHEARPRREDRSRDHRASSSDEPARPRPRHGSPGSSGTQPPTRRTGFGAGPGPRPDKGLAASRKVKRLTGREMPKRRTPNPT